MLATLTLLTGIWRAVLATPGGELPFNFEVKTEPNKTTIEIINGDERIVVDEIKTVGDSVFIRLPIFDSEIKAIVTDGKMQGTFFNYARKTDNQISFTAQHNISSRFIIQNPNAKPANLSGRWAVRFSEGMADSSDAIGVFKQNGNHITGTFLTTTGDYRYLDGIVDGDSLFLSCFDGSHAFLFKSVWSDGALQGNFYSGIHWQEPWTALKNEHAELPDAYSITYMKPGYTTVDFSFLDLDSNVFTCNQKYYSGKVTVLQIMGSWCPNCMDETAFLSPFYLKHKSKNFQVVGLAFEKTNDFQKSVANVKRLAARYKVEYTILIAGTSNKEDASKAFPMLNKISGYPTTIIIDKKGMVRKIHTGFSGPATGKNYDKFVEEFTMFIEKLERE
jgi:thiol-disulfide isomerase/thioredoxin